MAVIALTSMKGSPGVTTTALALTLVWPRPVLLIEADVVGGSNILAGWLRATVPHDRSLLDAAIALQHGTLKEQLPALTVPLPPDDPDSPRRLLPAIPQAVQATSLDSLWLPLSQLAASLGATGTDVIVDAGRFGATHGPLPMLHGADAVLVVARTTLPAVSGVAAALPPLKEQLANVGRGVETLALLTVGHAVPGPTGATYSAREIYKALDTPVLGTISHDPVSAEVISLGATPHRRFDRSSLMRSAGSVADAAGHLAQRQADRLRTRLRIDQPAGERG